VRQCCAFRAAKHIALRGRGFTESEAKLHTPRNTSQSQVSGKVVTEVTQEERFQELNVQNFSRDCEKEAQNCLPVCKPQTPRKWEALKAGMGEKVETDFFNP